MLKRVDLHFHSNYSDGSLGVEEVLNIVARSGVVLASLTDHDTVKGVGEASKMAKELGIKLIPGVEISTMYENGEVHILGYNFEVNDSRFNRFLEERFESRRQKIVKTVEKLNNLGYNVSFDDVSSQSPGSFVGRVNVAKALVNKGYVKSARDAFTPNLIGDKGAAYVAPSGLSPEEAIEKIHLAGGVAVLAHPGLYRGSDNKYGLKESDVLKMVEWGLDGVEAYHSKHTHSIANYYYDMARVHGLMVTAGTDYHHGVYPIEFMSTPREVVFELLKNFLKGDRPS